ncbi:MAG: hypothetical protein ABR961_03365 [Thermoanaerobaculaceae bacterium]|jgi:16S rRNA A1518/A1519 N6-dimethyltransferase RsmA/KsgA/DIM1 with predicted DNA glycosylase/AP lyase activity
MAQYTVTLTSGAAGEERSFHIGPGARTLTLHLNQPSEPVELDDRQVEELRRVADVAPLESAYNPRTKAAKGE